MSEGVRFNTWQNEITSTDYVHIAKHVHMAKLMPGRKYEDVSLKQLQLQGTKIHYTYKNTDTARSIKLY